MDDRVGENPAAKKFYNQIVNKKKSYGDIQYPMEKERNEIQMENGHPES